MTLALDPKVIGAVHGALKGIPERKNVIPIWGMYLLQPDESGIAVTATDGDIEATMTVAGAVASFEAVCVPPYLLEAAGGLRAEAVRIALDDRQAIFSAGRARFAAPVLPGSDFPRATIAAATSFFIAGDALSGLIGSTIDAVQVDGDRFYLQGVHLSTREGRIHAVATDGHRLHTTSVALTGEPVEIPPDLIIPTKAAKELARVAGKAGGNPVLVEIGEGGIAVTAGDERIVSKLIAGTYPDWRRVVPQATGVSATVDLAEMLAALDRVMKVQSINEADLKSKSKATAVRLEEAGDALAISAGRGGDIAEAKDGVAAEFAGEWGAHGVSGRYLRTTLSAMRDRGVETITIDTAGAGTPLRIESPGDEDFLAIVMPMRL